MTSDDARPASSQRTRPLTAELVVQEPAALAIAHRVAPDRIELCTGLALGGLTPSVGLLDAAVAVRAAGGPAVHVLIRPRTGTFVHDPDEIDVMVRDVREAVARGADGVVVGAARRRDTGTGPGTALDLAAIGAMREAAGGAEVTVHRVIDTVTDPVGAVEELAGLGVTRVLTSGAAPRATDGVATLRAMVAAADGRVQIQAGGGVTAATVAELVAAGVDALHSSASAVRRGEAQLSMGAADDGEGRAVLDEDLARAFVAAVRAARRQSPDTNA